MAQQNIENFWNICEEQLKLYMKEFNNSMGSKGFKVEYKILDETPIGTIYSLVMNYHQFSLSRGDIFLSSMHVPQEIITNITELLCEIQD